MGEKTLPGPQSWRSSDAATAAVITAVAALTLSWNLVGGSSGMPCTVQVYKHACY